MNYILAIFDFILGVMNLYMYSQNGSFKNLLLGIVMIGFGISFYCEDN